MNDHLQYCHMRPVECKYCELTIPITDGQYDKHVTYCGSKTRTCEECKSTIMQREMKAHVTSGQCELAKEMQAERERERLERDLIQFQ
jgi:hypothetical protein